MTGRDFQRAAYSVKVEFRTASSFLVAYTLNLSRGGLFIETNDLASPGSEVGLNINVPGIGPISTQGTVSWCRETPDDEGPRGIGIEFSNLEHDLGEIIDHLVANFQGVNVLLYCSDDQDRRTLSKMIRQIIATAEVVGASDYSIAEAVIGADLDITIVDCDSTEELSLNLLRHAKINAANMPTIALSSTKEWRDRAMDAGAHVVANNPPSPVRFQKLLIDSLGRPATVA